MTQNDDAFDMDLDDLFKSAREATPEPSRALMQSIIHDADRVQIPSQMDIGAKASLFARIRQVFEPMGGLPALVGFSCAAVFGIWLGGFSSYSENILSFSSPEVAVNVDFVDPYSALDLSYFEENT